MENYNFLLLFMIAFVFYTSAEDTTKSTLETTANDGGEIRALQEEEIVEINFSNLTRKKKKQNSDLEIETPAQEYKITVEYDCFCGSEPNDDVNFPDVYMNFVYELDQHGTSLFNNKKSPQDDSISGRFKFKFTTPIYKKKNGKDHQQYEIHFYDHDPIGDNDYLGSAGKFDFSELVKNTRETSIVEGGGLKKCAGIQAQAANCLFSNGNVDIFITTLDLE